jgi:hypothetical protein
MRLLILLFLFLPFKATAGSCIWTDYFCDYSANYFEWTEGETTIVRAKFLEFRAPDVDGYAPLYDFEILEVIAGEMNENFVSLWGQDGANCNGPVIELTDEREYIVLFPTEEGYSSAYTTLSGGIENRYPIFNYPGCGTGTLEVQGQTIRGLIAEGVDVSSKAAFYERLEECAGIDVNSPEGPDRYNSYEVTILPNPVSDHFEVVFESETPVFDVSLYDMLGRLVLRNQLNGVGTTSHEMEVANLPAGVYNLVIGTDGLRVKKQVIVL